MIGGYKEVISSVWNGERVVLVDISRCTDRKLKIVFTPKAWVYLEIPEDREGLLFIAVTSKGRKISIHMPDVYKYTEERYKKELLDLWREADRYFPRIFGYSLLYMDLIEETSIDIPWCVKLSEKDNVKPSVGIKPLVGPMEKISKVREYLGNKVSITSSIEEIEKHFKKTDMKEYYYKNRGKL